MSGLDSGLGKSGTEATPEFKQTWAGQLADYVTAMAYGPKGKSWAATSTAGEVMLFRPEGAGFAGVALAQGSAAAVNCVGFSPDGQFLAAGGQAGRLWVWNVATQAVIAQLDYPRAWIDHLAWSPTQNQLAFSVGKAVQVWDAQTQTTTALNFGASSVLGLAWHPLGSHLAVGGYQGIQVWAARDWAAPPRGAGNADGGAVDRVVGGRQIHWLGQYGLHPGPVGVGQPQPLADARFSGEDWPDCLVGAGRGRSAGDGELGWGGAVGAPGG
jgi:Anaphase-promoting complex subunit 4 WD40 domain